MINIRRIKSEINRGYSDNPFDMLLPYDNSHNISKITLKTFVSEYVTYGMKENFDLSLVDYMRLSTMESNALIDVSKEITKQKEDIKKKMKMESGDD
jgi:hypothetical protein